MPKYNLKVTCPTTSSHSKRTETKLKVKQGIISQVSVTWSFGSNFLNALIVKYEGGQIIPSEGGGECRGNGDPETWPEYIELDRAHPEITVEIWNDGNEHEQEVLLSIVVLPKVPEWAKAINDLAYMLRTVLGL